MRGAALTLTSDLGIIADGIVDMTVRLGASPSFDISIGDWQGYNLTASGEIGQPTAVSFLDFDMRNIPINADGTFSAGVNEWRDKAGGLLIPPDGYTYPQGSDHDKGTAIRWGKRVSGAFYGPEAVEAAGMFGVSRNEHESRVHGPYNQRLWFSVSSQGVSGVFGARKPKE